MNPIISLSLARAAIRWALSAYAVLTGILALGLLAGCDRAEVPAAIVKISIYKDGGLIVSGFRTDPTKFDAAIAHMREKRTIVWLYDEPGPGVGAAIDRSVRQQLSEVGIPVRLYADEAFSQPKA